MNKELLDKIIGEHGYYNVTNLPFDYAAFIGKKNILDSIHNICKTKNEEARELEKEKLLKLIYTSIYKLNITEASAKEYFKKAIFTDKYKDYLAAAYTFTIKYNEGENPYITTLIHIAQLFMSDILYEYLWKLENEYTSNNPEQKE